MLSKLKVNFFRRFEVKLSIFYTVALLVISLMLSSFFYYRLEHNLLKQIERMLKDKDEDCGDSWRINCSHKKQNKRGNVYGKFSFESKIIISK
jgi:hypothetical protein